LFPSPPNFQCKAAQNTAPASIIRSQAKLYAAVRMRACSLSKSLRVAMRMNSIHRDHAAPWVHQWCQNSANKIIIGSGTPSSHSNAPFPKPIVVSHFSCSGLTRNPFVSSSEAIAYISNLRFRSMAVHLATSVLSRKWIFQSRRRKYAAALNIFIR
jgi:hypothetical protein